MDRPDFTHSRSSGISLTLDCARPLMLLLVSKRKRPLRLREEADSDLLPPALLDNDRGGVDGAVTERHYDVNVAFRNTICLELQLVLTCAVRKRAD